LSLKVVPMRRDREAGPAMVIRVVMIAHAEANLNRYSFALTPISNKSEILFSCVCPKGAYQMDTTYLVYIEREQTE
jgi:hypothetical protein